MAELTERVQGTVCIVSAECRLYVVVMVHTVQMIAKTVPGSYALSVLLSGAVDHK
jgi:hypothetical protein